MCRTAGRRCPGRDDPRHREAENARQRVSRNISRAAAARSREDVESAETYDALAEKARAHLAGLEAEPTPPATDQHPLANAPAEPVDFRYVRNPVSSQGHGVDPSAYGQDIEPSGRYMSEAASNGFVPDGWQSGTVHFERPLRVEVGGGYTEDSGWKRRLSAHYGGKTGAALSRALRDDGYDAIITSDKYGTSEVVDLTHLSSPAKQKVPSAISTNAPTEAPTAASVQEDLLRRNPGAQLDMYRSKGGHVVVSKIIVPKGQRGSGVGTKMMTEIVETADREGWPLALTPDSAFGGSKTRLEKFYRGFGFVPNRGRSKDFTTTETMVREPQG